RAARLFARHRARHRAEDRRLPHGPRGVPQRRRARRGTGYRSGARGAAARVGRPVRGAPGRLEPVVAERQRSRTEEWTLRNYPYVLAAAACAGLAAANAFRGSGAVVIVLAVAPALACAVAADPLLRVGLLSVALATAGWWWGSARLDAIDSSVLVGRVGEAGLAVAVVTGPARGGEFDLRLPARLIRFGDIRLGEPVLLDLPVGRSPPQGAIIALDARVRLPRTAAEGFDERTWLRGHGVHVVLLGRDWRIVGRRGGIGGYADRVRAWLARGVAPGLSGERRAILAVSGQNVIFVAAAVLGLAWLLRVPRWLGELGALGGIASYVLAVGAQPSVIRAGIAGALGSLAWLSARQRDRWHFLLVGALVLLAWSPYNLLDPGFQLSFAAVVAIFVAVPKAKEFFAGYPLPRGLPEVLAVSLACGIATAPILWLQFGRI